MSERDEIARLVIDEYHCTPRSFAEFADALMAAGVRHLPSLADDPEMVERAAMKLHGSSTDMYWRRVDDTTKAACRDIVRGLLGVLAGGE